MKTNDFSEKSFNQIEIYSRTIASIFGSGTVDYDDGKKIEIDFCCIQTPNAQIFLEAIIADDEYPLSIFNLIMELINTPERINNIEGVTNDKKKVQVY